eukprot:3123675-Rhodomonas_salina.2
MAPGTGRRPQEIAEGRLSMTAGQQRAGLTCSPLPFANSAAGLSEILKRGWEVVAVCLFWASSGL